ncbi:CoA transferase [Polaromonas sp. P1-6]|nr:CoA transferase [Polaromonas sp. P1-6]
MSTATSSKKKSPGRAALDGIRIIDLTTVIMGPYGTRILADMGADVIKVESPEGDAFRRFGPQRNKGMGGSVLNLHRNKRSIVLDLKEDTARKAFDRLLSTADVLVHNLRPQAAQRLSLDGSSLRQNYPDLIICAARGFGQDGPYGHKAAYDDLIQAGSGFATLNGELYGEPRYAPTAWCDKIAGQAIAYAVLGALFHRERGGGGQEVEVPMFETAIDFMLVEHFGAGAFEPPMGRIGFPRQLSPQRKPYRTLDGWACILPYSDQNWRDFFNYTGHRELADDPAFSDVAKRLENIDELYRLLEQQAAQRSTAEWVAFCDSVSIPCMPVLGLDVLKDDPHVRAVELMELAEHPTEGSYRQIRSPIRFSAAPFELRHHAPSTGQHTGEILREAGVSEEDLQLLLSPGYDEAAGSASRVAATATLSE